MTKTYASRLSYVSLYVKVDGKMVYIELKPGFIDANGNRGSSFTTDDKKLQVAIESHSYFGPDWRYKIYTEDFDENKALEVPIYEIENVDEASEQDADDANPEDNEPAYDDDSEAVENKQVRTRKPRTKKVK